MRSEGQAEALKFGEEIFLVIDWGTGRREKEGAGIVWARYVATLGNSTFCRAFIFWFMRVAQLLYGRGMPRPIAKVSSSAHSIMANYWVAACRDRTSPLPPGSSTFLRAFNNLPPSSSTFRRAFNNAKSMSSGMPRPYTSFASNHQPLSLPCSRPFFPSSSLCPPYPTYPCSPPRR